MYPHSITHTIQFPVIDLCNTCGATKNIVFPGLEVFEEGIKLPLLYMIFYDYSFRSSVGDTAWKKLILETEDPTEPLAPEQGEGLLCFYLGTTTLLGCGKPNRNTRIYWSLNWAWRTTCIHIHGTTNQKAEDFKVIQRVHKLKWWRRKIQGLVHSGRWRLVSAHRETTNCFLERKSVPTCISSHLQTKNSGFQQEEEGKQRAQTGELSDKNLESRGNWISWDLNWKMLQENCGRLYYWIQ